MNTYALCIKRTYKDLTTSIDKDVFEIVDVYGNQEEAEDALLGYDVYARLYLNKIDTKGIFKSFVSKVITFEGQVTKEQAQAMMDASGYTIFYMNQKSR